MSAEKICVMLDHDSWQILDERMSVLSTIYDFHAIICH